MTILAAVQRLQAHALASSSDIKIAPDTPIENASALPMVITHIADGSANVPNATQMTFLPVLAVDFFVNRANLKNAYTQIDNFIPEFLRRLAGDPRLNNTVDSIVFPVTWERPALVEFGNVSTLVVSFLVPVKTLETPKP